MSSSPLPTILVTGATGSTGLEVVTSLSNSGRFRVLAGVRDVTKAQQMATSQLPRVSVVHLDSDAASAASAFQGVTGVYLLTAPRQPSFAVWLRAMKQAGVQHVIYHSAIGSEPSSPMSMGVEHGQHEATLKAQTDLSWTIFQPTFFHQNLEKFDAPLIQQYDMFGGSADDGRFSSVGHTHSTPPSPITLSHTPHYPSSATFLPSLPLVPPFCCQTCETWPMPPWSSSPPPPRTRPRRMC